MAAESTALDGLTRRLDILNHHRGRIDTTRALRSCDLTSKEVKSKGIPWEGTSYGYGGKVSMQYAYDRFCRNDHRLLTLA